MKKKRLAIISILLILTLLSITTAQQLDEKILITFKDINTNEPITSGIAKITLDGRIHTFYIQKNSAIELTQEFKNKNLEIRIDNLATEGKDYYAKTKILSENPPQPEQIIVYPVGTLRATVKDKLDNLVGNAKLKFDCNNPEIIDYPETTDNFGTFSIDYFPSGNCKIFATYNKVVGFTQIKISKGAISEIEIKLDKTIVSDNGNNWIIPLLIMAIIILIIFFIARKKLNLLQANQQKIKPKETSDNKTKIPLGKRAHDILATLKDKEKDIIQFLAEHNGKSTQSKIYYTTGIPKVSLSRYIRRLEQKNIISINKVSKVNHLQLTEWFVSDDNVQE